MYVIKRFNHPIGEPNTIYEEILNESDQFVIAGSKQKFPTVGNAVCKCHNILPKMYKPQIWIEGPRKGRYNPVTGRRLK